MKCACGKVELLDENSYFFAMDGSDHGSTRCLPITAAHARDRLICAIESALGLDHDDDDHDAAWACEAIKRMGEVVAAARTLRIAHDGDLPFIHGGNGLHDAMSALDEKGTK